MIRHIAVLAALLATPAVAVADGFAVTDLRTLPVDVSPYAGGTFDYGSLDPDRLTIFCEDCDGLVMVDLQLDQQIDGTEARVRSGETTIEALRQQCQARNDTCTLEGITLGPAIGWVTSFVGMAPSSTTVLLRDGDMLTIQSLGPDLETARRNGEIARANLAPTIIGN